MQGRNAKNLSWNFLISSYRILSFFLASFLFFPFSFIPFSSAQDDRSTFVPPEMAQCERPERSRKVRSSIFDARPPLSHHFINSTKINKKTGYHDYQFHIKMGCPESRTMVRLLQRNGGPPTTNRPIGNTAPRQRARLARYSITRPDFWYQGPRRFYFFCSRCPAAEREGKLQTTHHHYRHNYHCRAAGPTEDEQQVQN